jgi:hypothetical protein
MRAIVRAASRAAVLVVSAALPSRAARAQTEAPLGFEGRVDAIVGHDAAAQLGAGLNFFAGYYTRIGLIAATGIEKDSRASSGIQSVTRVDVITRFLFDPFREVPRGISLGGGISVANTQNGRWRPYLVGVIDIEGQKRGPVVPALQLGLGGGARVGVILRSASRGWR